MAHQLFLPQKNEKCGRSSIGRASPCQGEGRGFETRRPLHDSLVPLAQLDRAFDYESKGREFESLRARHLIIVIGSVQHSVSLRWMDLIGK